MRIQIARFAFAGLAGFLVDAGVLWLGLHIGLGYFAGRGVSFLAAVWTTWQLNRRFTFSGHRTVSAHREWWRYLAAMSVGGCVNYAAYTVAVLALRHTPLTPFLGVALGSLAGMAVNFASARWWVFRCRTRQ